MTGKRKKIIIAFAVALTAVLALVYNKSKKKEGVSIEVIKPVTGTIKTFITCTGTVLPQNRLEIKPPVNGRVEKIFVNEGDRVRRGRILTEISSTERAALIDAARSQGGSSIKYWEDAYKPILMIAPINGTVIVRSVEPGQTVVTTQAILVLSDLLIVKANVDETDIGKVKTGQLSAISLDAYPSVKVNGRVSQISYESKIVNNVTMYEVNIIPDRVPEVFRSGMSSNVQIISETKENILLLPVNAVKSSADGDYVFVKKSRDGKPEKRLIKVGISDEKNIEVISGLDENDTVLIITKNLNSSKKENSGLNPFGPRKRKKQ